jgi:photosystem II stability/assembly factor-like uncharacterized protein
MKQHHKLKTLLADTVFYFSILFFIIAFNFSDTAVNGWYQQFMPNLGGAQLSDITFVDSLNGFATTLYRTTNDSAFILKTINGGDNWSINQTYNYPFYKVQFINRDTGFALSFQKLFKTTNRGSSWQIINIALSTAFVSMYVLNTDTIWGVATESLTGGVYRTTNGGANWDQQINLGSSNPNHIYMYNGRMGFIGQDNFYLRRTSDGGQTWTLINGAGGFLDMHFVDSLTGWKTSMQKTTDGGLNWVNQIFPITYASGIIKFSHVSRDTIWGVGGIISYPNGQFRGIIYNSTNGGNIWRYQIPDTSINIFKYLHNEFTNQLIGWAYATQRGVHTTTGGNDTFFTSIKQISSNTPENFKLNQNYPNPFNPSTRIGYELKVTGYVKILIYDITGKAIESLVDKKQNPGIYIADFNGANYSSGIYFYSLVINNQLIDTKKMILVK